MSQLYHMDRRFKYLWDNRVVYRRNPTTDIPDEETEHYMFYKDGTHQCYDLFRSKAKITTWRSFYWHMMVLWHLNPEWDDAKAMEVATFLAHKPNGFTTFTINNWNIARLVHEVSVLDLETPPQNKLRKIIFKPNSGLDKLDKLKIVGKLIGRLRGVQKEDLYETMLLINESEQKITIAKLANSLGVTPRTIHRHMCDELKQVKEELNEEINI
tara:strand:- start:22 stop:660 length:639 start_codon:yes stop_codon:yes gene_type:complete